MTTDATPFTRSTAPIAKVLLIVATAAAVFSGLLGLVPLMVEPAGAVDPVNCGSTWFRESGLPSECYTTVDVWAAAAKAGLGLAAILAAGVAVSRALVSGRAAASHWRSHRHGADPDGQQGPGKPAGQ